MTLILSFFLRAISILATLVTLVSGVIAPPAESFHAKDEAALKTTFSVISDVHMETNNLDRFTTFRKSLQDMNRAKRNDMLLMLGDNTMNAQGTEYLMLYSHLAAYNKLFTLAAMGNHDINEGENKPKDAIARHNRFLNAYPYSLYYNEAYSCTMHAITDSPEDLYYFVVLGSEGAAGTNAYISPEQLAFLEETVAEASANGNPLFVACHQPLNTKAGNWWGEGGKLGEQSDAVEAILKSYPGKVFFFSGHLHNAFDSYPNHVSDNITMVDLPCFTGESGTGGGQLTGKGYGYQVEVYEDTVLLRGRNFMNGEWVDSMEFSFPAK